MHEPTQPEPLARQAAALAAHAEQVADQIRIVDAERRLGAMRERRLVAALDEVALAEAEIAKLCSRAHLARRVEVVAPAMYVTPECRTAPAHLAGAEAIRPYLERDLARTRHEAAREVADYRTMCEDALRRLAVGRASPVAVSIWEDGVLPGDDFDPVASRKPAETREFERTFGDHTFDDGMATILAKLETAGDADLEGLHATGAFDAPPPLTEPQGLARIAQILDETHDAIHACLAASPRETGIPAPRAPVPIGSPTLTVAVAETDAILARELAGQAITSYLARIRFGGVSAAYEVLQADAVRAISAAQGKLQQDLVDQLVRHFASIEQATRYALEALRSHLGHEQAMVAARQRCLETEREGLRETERQIAEVRASIAPNFPT